MPAPLAEPSPVAPAPEAGIDLAARRGDGLEVTLLWSRASGRVWVVVLHVFTGESFRIDVDPQNALEVYRHPFAYCLRAAESSEPIEDGIRLR
jgi:hypothetical protein